VVESTDGSQAFDRGACEGNLTVFDGFRINWGEMTDSGETQELGGGVSHAFCWFLDISQGVRYYMRLGSIVGFILLLVIWARRKIAAFSGTQESSSGGDA
jgi:hypothetical protein